MTKATQDRMRVVYASQGQDFATAATSAWKDARVRNAEFTRPDQVVQSAELRTDRQVVDQIATTQNVEGSTPCEWSYGGHPDWLKAALESPASPSAVSVDNVQAAATGSVFSATGIDDNLSVGDWVRGFGFTEAANNGWHQVTDASTPDQISVGSTLVDEAAASGQRIVMSSKIVNGTNFEYFTILRGYEDLTNIKAQHIGCRIGGWDFTIDGKNVLAHSFSWMGKSESTITALPGSITPFANNPIMSGGNAVEGVYIGGTKRGTTALSLSLSNNLRMLDQDVGNGPEPCDINAGKIAVTVSHTGYYDDTTDLSEAFSRSATGIAIATQDALGNGYVIDIPRARAGSPSRNGGGENTEIFASAEFAAMLDPTTGQTIRIFGATVPA